MSNRLNFEQLSCLFESNKDFELTDVEYREKVGKPLPQGKSYITNNSPLAKKAKEYGYILQVVEKPIIQRTVVFKKIASE